jgi:RNA polymerase sigma-70 factor (ECF subfamily)
MTVTLATGHSGRNDFTRYAQVETIRRGNRVPDQSAVVAELYEKYARLVHRRAMRFFPDSEAEEVTHEVFVQVIEKLDTFRADASPATWLYRITTNHCLNRIRNRGRRQELWRERAIDVLPSSSLAPNQEAVVFLRQLWADLPDELLRIAVYYHVDGLTHGEIARIVGLSRRSVGNRLDELTDLARKRARGGPP